jgi:cytochrome c5
LRFGAVFSILAIGIVFTPSCRAADSDVFSARCVICHQQNAQGVPGMYPPLANSIGNYLQLKQGREYLIEVALHGMTGAVDVNGTTYNGLMPSFSQLPDAEIADALNYVLTKFNADKLPKDFAPITAAEVNLVRTKIDSTTSLPKERESLMNDLKKAHPPAGASP